MIDFNTIANKDAESIDNWLIDQGFLEAKTVVLHASAIVLSREIDPELPWCYYDDYGHNRYMDIDAVEQLAELFDLPIDLTQKDRMDSIKLYSSKYETIIVDKLFANFENGTLRLIEFFADGTMSYTQHAGQIDVHWIDFPVLVSKEAR